MCVTGVNKRSGIDQKIQLLQTSFNFPRPTRHQLQKILRTKQPIKMLKVEFRTLE